MGQGVDGGGIGLGGFYRFHHAFGLAARGRGDPRDEQDPLRERDEVGEGAADAEARVAARWYRRFWSSCGASAVSRIVRTVTKVRAAAKITFTPPRRLSPGQAQGKAELIDVVTSVAAAEASLETVMAVRDQVIAAYQEIMRMPI